MINNYLNSTASWYGRVLTIVVAFMAFGAVHAVAGAINGGTLEDGKQYRWNTGYGTFDAIYTAPKNGTIQILAVQNAFMAGDLTVTEDGVPLGSSRFAKKKTDYASKDEWEILDAKAGSVYALHSEFVMNSYLEIKVSLLNPDEYDPIQLVSTTLKAGAIYASDTDEFQVRFSTDVANRAFEAYIVYGGKLTPVTCAISTYSDRVLCVSGISDKLAEINAVPNEKFTIAIMNIANAEHPEDKYNTDGTFSIELTVPQKRTFVASQSKPDMFLSYWAEGDPRGQIVITFTENLAQPKNWGASGGTPYADLSMGNMEMAQGVGFFRELLKYTVEGNKLYIDLTGKRRLIRDILPGRNEDEESEMSQVNTDFMTLQIPSILDIHGNFIHSEDLGSVGSITINLPYQEVLYNIAAEVEPMPNSNIKKAGTFDLWAYETSSPAKNIIPYLDGMTGIEVRYFEGGVEKTTFIAKGEGSDVENEDGDIHVWTNAIPSVIATADEGSKVTVEVKGITMPDGIDHSKVFTSTFYVGEPPVLISRSNPVADSEMSGILAEGSVYVNLNRNDGVEKVTAKITDLSNGSVIFESELPQISGTREYSLQLEQEIVFKKGRNYTMEVEVLNADGVNLLAEENRVISFVGTTSWPNYSEATLQSISIVDGQEIDPETDLEVAVSFSQSAFFDQSNGEEEAIHLLFAESDGNVLLLTPVTEDQQNFTITIPASFLQTAGETVTFHLSAVDMDEKFIQLSAGDEKGSYTDYVLKVKGHFVDAIGAVQQTATDAAVYTLGGVRARQMQKGINIVGGKKILVK